MARISLHGITKSYSRRTKAVESVDLSVEDGEFLVLVGPSGCGKTTTLRMIAGLEQATDGEIWIGDQQVNEVPPRDRDIAMVFQNYALYPHMTVYKNLSFGLELRYGGGWLLRLIRRLVRPAKAKTLEPLRLGIHSRVVATAKTLGIEHLLKRKPHQLSGGERQRVALGRAIVREPAAFLFDEPLSNLDARLRTEMRVELKRLHRQLGATMVYVTHDQVEALTLGDRIAVMDKGVVRQLGTPAEIYDQPSDTFVATFVGHPGMNLLRGRLEKSDAGLEFVSEAGRWPVTKNQARATSVAGGENAPTGDLRAEYANPESSEPALPVELEAEAKTSAEAAMPADSAEPAEDWVEKCRMLSEYLGHEVLMGVRPEDVKLLGPVSAVDEPGEGQLGRELGLGVPMGGSFRLSGDVVAVDRLGDSAMLYLDLGTAIAEQGPINRREEKGGEANAGRIDLKRGRSPGKEEQVNQQDPQRSDSEFGEFRPSDSSRQEFVVRTGGRIPDLAGNQVWVAIDPARAHFFDAESGINLLKAAR